MRTQLACAAILCAALVSGHALTDGFAAFTSEDARALAVQRAPKSLPLIKLIDTVGQSFNLRDATQGGSKVVLLDFFFTRCESVCLALGSQFQRLQNEIARRGLQDRVTLLSISFDPAYDTSQALANYAKRMHADTNIWRFATAASDADLALARSAFYVVVIPDPVAIYQHNAAIHVISADGKLSRIIDYESADTALDIALGLPSAQQASAQ